MKQLILKLSFLFPPFVALAQEPPLAFETSSRKFSNIVNYAEGRAKIRLYGINGWGFMDATGKMVIAPQFNEVTPFREGRAIAVSKEENY